MTTQENQAPVRALCPIIDGFIVPPTHVELIATDHCNIGCRTCNHASPLMPAWFAKPETVRRDFAILAKYYRPAFVKVLGGEPLMHKQLAAVIQAARETGISRHFTLVTNGMLLHRAPDELWDSIDEIEISIYPNIPGTEEILALAEKKTRSLGKKLTVYHYDDFRATFSLRGTDDTGLVSKIYAACKIANLWGCHAVKDGYFYKCPQSIYIPELTGKRHADDRVEIVDDVGFRARLHAFLNSPTPLAACTHCVGTVGIQETHALLPKDACRQHIDKRSEDLVDPRWLEHSLQVQDVVDDCKIPTRYQAPWLERQLPGFFSLLETALPSAWKKPLHQRRKPNTRQIDSK